MKLTLSQFVTGMITGNWPGEGQRQHRELTDLDHRQIKLCRTAYFIVGDERKEVIAVSLVEEDGDICGVFENEDGQTFAGTWNEERRSFVGTRIRGIHSVTPAEVEYNSDVTAYPPGATEGKFDSWADKGRPIHLNGGGRPTRHITESCASQYTWWPLFGGGFGWVKDSD